MSAWGSFCEVGRSVCRSAVCFNTHVGRANIIRKCELVCVCVVSGRETMRILCYVPREAELCLHMYLLTLDPPHKYSLMKQNNSNLFGWNFTPGFFFSTFCVFCMCFVWVFGVILVWVREPAPAPASNSPCRIYQTSAGYEFPCHTGRCSFYHFRIKD